MQYPCSCQAIDVCATNTSLINCQLCFVDVSNASCDVDKKKENKEGRKAVQFLASSTALQILWFQTVRSRFLFYVPFLSREQSESTYRFEDCSLKEQLSIRYTCSSEREYQQIATTIFQTHTAATISYPQNQCFLLQQARSFQLALTYRPKIVRGIELNGLSIKITLGIGFQINQVSCLLVIYSNANRRASPFRAQNGLP
ncbi:hypothetical protein BD560DRAFT_490792 [Blakeslea trispora]|nr:hypothetical protein BD560DRAFT_490792 [Blakeslea trispora]